MWCDLQSQLPIILNMNWKEAWLSGICTHKTTFASNSRLHSSQSEHLWIQTERVMKPASWSQPVGHTRDALELSLVISVVNKCKVLLAQVLKQNSLPHQLTPHSTVFGVSKISIQRNFLLEGNFMGPADALMQTNSPDQAQLRLELKTSKARYFRAMYYISSKSADLLFCSRSTHVAEFPLLY